MQQIKHQLGNQFNIEVCL